MTATTTSMTAGELERMPEDANRYDLIRGVLTRTSLTGYRHRKVAGTSPRLLSGHPVLRGLGVVGGEGGFVLELDPDTVLAPGVELVRTERLPPENRWDRFARLAPALVVEFVSPSDARAEIEAKVTLQLGEKVPPMTVVHPRRRTVSVRTPEGGDRHLNESRRTRRRDGAAGVSGAGGAALRVGRRQPRPLTRSATARFEMRRGARP